MRSKREIKVNKDKKKKSNKQEKKTKDLVVKLKDPSKKAEKQQQIDNNSLYPKLDY